MCRRSLPWEYVPAIILNGKVLAGTAVWRSQLVEERCAEEVGVVAAHAERPAGTDMARLIARGAFYLDHPCANLSIDLLGSG